MEGNPNTPLPMTEFTTSAARLQRPMARTRCLPGAGFWVDSRVDSVTARLYHKWRFTDESSGLGVPGFAPLARCARSGQAQAWTAEAAIPARVARRGYNAAIRVGVSDVILCGTLCVASGGNRGGDNAIAFSLPAGRATWGKD